MKKLGTFLLLLSLGVFVVGCGGGDDTTPDTTDDTTETTDDTAGEGEE